MMKILHMLKSDWLKDQTMTHVIIWLVYNLKSDSWYNFIGWIQVRN